MTGRDLNAWLGTGDGREPAPQPLTPTPVTTTDLLAAAHRLTGPSLDDQAWALGFMRMILARHGGSRPCA